MYTEEKRRDVYKTEERREKVKKSKSGQKR